MRLDQEAAVKAYRAALTEAERIAMRGGAVEATPALSAAATGDYLRLVLKAWRLAFDEKLRPTAPIEVTYAAAEGWSPSEIHIKACEDLSKVKILDRKGRDRTPTGPKRYVQDYTVVKSGNAWKVSDVSTERVDSFEDYGCKR